MMHPNPPPPPSSSIWLAVVPPRITFALFSIYAFTRPLRHKSHKQPPAGSSTGSAGGGQAGGGGAGAAGGIAIKRKSLVDLLISQWLSGIPLDAPTHRDISVAVQMALAKRDS